MNLIYDWFYLTPTVELPSGNNQAPGIKLRKNLCLHQFITFQVFALGTAHRVSDCPRDDKEWMKASDRLNCSSDVWSTMNKYHCLPADNLTTLIELCYSKKRPRVVKGTHAIQCTLSIYVPMIQIFSGMF